MRRATQSIAKHRDMGTNLSASVSHVPTQNVTVVCTIRAVVPYEHMCFRCLFLQPERNIIFDLLEYVSQVVGTRCCDFRNVQVRQWNG